MTTLLGWGAVVLTIGGCGLIGRGLWRVVVRHGDDGGQVLVGAGLLAVGVVASLVYVAAKLQG